MTQYVYNTNDGSYFGLDDNVVVVDVPTTVEGEDIEQYLSENEASSVKVIDHMPSAPVVDPIVTITVDGPRASGVTRIADAIGQFLKMMGDTDPDYPKVTVIDADKERDGNG